MSSASETFEQSFDTRTFVNNLTQNPGVYRMLDEQGHVLYVGKAKNLKKRVSSYFRRRGGISPRAHSMVTQLRRIEITVTRTEAEALLLEANLIKQHRPRYNVQLLDDKSYPYVYLSTGDEYPRLAFHRGARRGRGRYFGPYPSAGAVRESLKLLQKLFRLRQCEDSFFHNRSRPCLQYQIKRCTGPCVGLISPGDYQHDVRHTVQFLEGKSEAVIGDLVADMERASERQDYERAAIYRDRIEQLRRVSERQYVSGEGGDVDIVACALKASVACVQVFNIRNGHNLGNKAFFPLAPEDIDEPRLLTAFLGQYYLNREVPGEIIVSHRPADAQALTEMLTVKRGQRLGIAYAVRGERARWLELAARNAEHSLQARIASKTGMLRRLEALQEELGLDAVPNRMECFDISHIAGEATMAACVVFDGEGPVKSDYRRFNIKGTEAGDDYAALRQALIRRYTRLKQGEGKLPDILFIDGGKGQVRQAMEVLEELQVEGVILIGVAKGAGRKAGLERLIFPGRPAPMLLSANSPALHLIQQIRDEAHRFAITGHRQRRARARSRSPLEQISGLGPKRRQTLLKRFGGLRGVSRAGVEELAKVPGISKRLAEDVYESFHVDNGQ